MRSLMDSRAILPAQFGRVLDDDEAVGRFAAGAGAICCSSSRESAGRSSSTCTRVGSPAPIPLDPRSESDVAYLRDRLETRQSARRLASQLDPLTALARSIRRTLSPQPDLPVLDAYLVDRGRVSEFVALVNKLGGYIDGVELVCTGPCPP